MTGRIVNYWFSWITDIFRMILGHWTTHEWREWTAKQARRYGLQEEALSDFDHFVRSGDHPSIAATSALYEWDI